MPDRVIGVITAVEMSAANSDHDYRYKTDFDIWRGNQEFDRQNISMSLPPFDLTPIGTNTKFLTTSNLDSTPIGGKNARRSATNTTNGFVKRKEKRTYQRTWSRTFHRQTHHRENLICLMTAKTENLRARDAIKRKIVKNTQKRTCRTHCQETLT